MLHSCSQGFHQAFISVINFHKARFLRHNTLQRVEGNIAPVPLCSDDASHRYDTMIQCSFIVLPLKIISCMSCSRFLRAFPENSIFSNLMGPAFMVDSFILAFEKPVSMLMKPGLGHLLS